MPADEKTDASPQSEGGQEVERIREIIFGTNIRDYEQRFQNMKRDLDRLQQELDHLTEQLTDQGGNQNKKLQELRREMRQADDDLRGEFRETTQRLTTEKVDRMALGELFVELGTHLKAGGSLTDLLEGLNARVE